MPETTRAAEIMMAMITLRMCLSSLGGSRLCCRLCHVRGASPLGLPSSNTAWHITQVRCQHVHGGEMDHASGRRLHVCGHVTCAYAGMGRNGSARKYRQSQVRR